MRIRNNSHWGILALSLLACQLRAQTVLLNYDFNNGLSTGWQTFNPGWAVVNGVYQGTNTAANTTVESVWANGYAWKDYVVTADVNLQGGYTPSDAQVIFRYQNPNSYDACRLLQYGGTFLMLSDPVRGVVAQVAFPAVLGQWYTLRAGIKGNQATCEVVGFPATLLTATLQGNATGTVGVRNTHIPAWFDNVIVLAIDPPEAFQVRYASNLTSADSVINLINTGTNGAPLNGPGFGPAVGNICVNLYAFSPDEQLVSCCSCLVTPNGLASLSVDEDLISNTLTGVRPNSVVVKLVNTGAGTGFTGTTCTNSAALAGGPAFPLAGGMRAFGTTVHGGNSLTETPFLQATLSAAELAGITNRCTNIVGNGSTFGICRSCRNGGLSAKR